MYSMDLGFTVNAIQLVEHNFRNSDSVKTVIVRRGAKKSLILDLSNGVRRLFVTNDFNEYQNGIKINSGEVFTCENKAAKCYLDSNI